MESMAADNKQVTVLIGLDLSAAFDTVDHKILLQWLYSEFGVTDTPLSWLRLYLEGRTNFVKLGQHQSLVVGLDIGVPQGFVLGPLLFAVYCSPVTDVIALHNHTQYFEDKVDGVRLATADAPPPTFTYAPAGCILYIFRPLAGDDIAKAVRMLPDKQCTSDPMPTGLFKQVADVLEPFLVEHFNRSLSEGLVQSVFKAAYVM